MKHIIEIEDDKQFNLIFMALSVLLRFYTGKWHYAFQDMFPYGYGLEILSKEHRAINTIIQTLPNNKSKISIYNKKLDNKARVLWDILQVFRHHTWNLKTKEERIAEPIGKRVTLIDDLTPIKVSVIE